MEDFKFPSSQGDLIFTLKNLNLITNDTGILCLLVRIKREIQETGLAEDFLKDSI